MGLIGTIFNYTRLYRIQQFTAILANIGLSRTKYDYMGPWDCKGPCGTVQDHRGSNGTIRALGEYTEL